MTTLHLPTLMLKPSTTSVVAVLSHSVNLSTSTLPDNNPNGEKRMVGPSPSAACYQQVAAHGNNTDHKEKLELEILKQASLREFEDVEFLRRLRYLRGSVVGERWQYREMLRSTLEFARVIVKPKNNVDMREIIQNTEDRLFHISRDL